MILTITRDFTFQAAHALPHVPKGHKCSTKYENGEARLHGHGYAATVEVRGRVQTRGPEQGMVADYGRCDDAWAEFIHPHVEHHTLNEVVGLENPTVELIAPWILSRLVERAPGVPWFAITLHETPNSSCRVTIDDLAGKVQVTNFDVR